MNDYERYISINPQIRFGKPCIAGTRIAVSDILQWLASGMSIDEILRGLSRTGPSKKSGLLLRSQSRKAG